MARYQIFARHARLFPLSVRVWASVFLLAWCVGALGESKDEARDNLERVRARLEAIAQELATAHNRHDALSQALADSEKLAGRIRREIASLDDRLAATHQRADATRRTLTRIRTEIAARRDRITRTVRASYRFARRNAVAMLLDLESPAEIDRVFTYHAIVERAHAQKLREIADTVSRFEALEAKAAEEAATITAIRDEKRRRLAELEEQRAARADAIRALAAQIRDRKSRAQQLRADERRMVKLIGAISAKLASVTPQIGDHKPFKTLRGKLPWPVKGALLARYGAPRGGGGLTWRGMLIGAPAGEPVRSIHRGRIVYADWLRGFGLLLIIEHGGGFMSLYGHNETLNSDVGDWVESGEIIATVGDSGGNPTPGLYFEIRRTGKPIDPRRWCVKLTTAALVSP